MAIFKVLSQRNEKRKFFSNETICSLTALPIEGELVDGMEFTAYETYHRFDVIIRSAQKTESIWHLECEANWTLYEDLFVGAVIDTSGMKRGQHYFFEHDNKYGPIAP
jgi:hypothetical protein